MGQFTDMMKIIELRRSRDLDAALRSAVSHIVEDCQRCPLHKQDDCAKNKLPPAARIKQTDSTDVVMDKSYCKDWITLHFLSAGREN